MNYLIIEGDDEKSLKYVVHVVAKELLNNEAFILKDGFLNESFEIPFCCVFFNKKTEKEILINTYMYSENHFKELLNFKRSHNRQDIIFLLFESEKLDFELKDIFSENDEDYILKLVLNKDADKDELGAQIIKLLSISPFNLY